MVQNKKVTNSNRSELRLDIPGVHEDEKGLPTCLPAYLPAKDTVEENKPCQIKGVLT